MSEQLSSLKFMTPRKIRASVVRCIQAGLVPYIKSSPGMGKSSIIRSIAAEFGLQVIDLRLSQCTPEDLQGLPRFRDITNDKGEHERTIAEFVPFGTFPIESTPVPKGYNGWLLMLDELSSAGKAIQAAAYKLILDKMVGQDNLHPNVAIVCAGNLDTDRAVTNPMSTAMQSRLVTLLMRLDKDEFLKDVGYAQGWDKRILAYINYKPSNLHDFRPDHNEHTFCSPRTWEFMNKLITGQPISEEDGPLFGGTITSGVATDFIQFTKIYDKLPKIQEILNDPNGIVLPSDNQARWSAAMMITDHAAPDTLDALTIYIERFASEFRIMFWRLLMAQKPTLRSEPAFRRALVDLSRYLND